MNIYPKQLLPSAWDVRERLREKGQFWTPSWVAKAMVAYVAEETDTIFDPATGRGAFLKALFDIRKSDVKYFGIDIDSNVLTDPIYKHSIATVENRDFITNPPQRKFKAIVANPPYIRHHRINNETKILLKQIATKAIGKPLDGRAGYHIYFLIQALNWLEQEGKLAFIMPADTCEGIFAQDLWAWISKKYCIEATITFSENATPFPNIDTNAIVFLIKNSLPNKTLHWVKVTQANSDALYEYIASKFTLQKRDAFNVSCREIEEALVTGLSRYPQVMKCSKYSLKDFADVMRGIATGSNSFFFLTSQQVEELNIPREFLKRAIGRTADATGDILTIQNLEDLDKKMRPTFLLSINEFDLLPTQISDYLQVGIKMDLPNQPLIGQRKPWYKMEKRQVPAILFAYLGRRNARFILNQTQAVPLTAFLCLYPHISDPGYIRNLWLALNHQDTLANLQLVGKSYGSGAIKVEPSGLRELPIPEHVVALYNLESIKCPHTTYTEPQPLPLNLDSDFSPNNQIPALHSFNLLNTSVSTH